MSNSWTISVHKCEDIRNFGFTRIALCTFYGAFVVVSSSLFELCWGHYSTTAITVRHYVDTAAGNSNNPFLGHLAISESHSTSGCKVITISLCFLSFVYGSMWLCGGYKYIAYWYEEEYPMWKATGTITQPLSSWSIMCYWHFSKALSSSSL